MQRNVLGKFNLLEDDTTIRMNTNDNLTQFDQVFMTQNY